MKVRRKRILRLMTLREIRGSFGRFFAIFAIVALGVGFFAGLRITTPDMLRTMDTFYREKGLFDYRALSTVGWEEADIEALRARPGVRAAEGAWQYDVLCENSLGDTAVYRAHSLTEGVNGVRLTEGRMPAAADECLLDANYRLGLSLGDTIRFTPENEEDTLDAFAGTGYTVVGLARSSLYTNFERGTTSIGNGAVTGFLYLPREAFTAEYYTELYIKLDADEELYSDAYADMMDAGRADWEDAVQKAADARFARLYAEAEAELADARAELDDKKTEGAEELDDAAAELDDAAAGLADAEAGLADARAELDDVAAELTSGRRTLDDTAAQLASGKAELEVSAAQLESGKAELDDTAAQLESGRAALDDTAAQLADARAALDDTAAQLEDFGAQLRDGRAALDENGAALAAAAQELEAAGQALDSTAAQLSQTDAALTAGEEALAQRQAELRAAAEAGLLDEEALAEAEAALAAERVRLEAGRAAYDEGMTAYEAARADYETSRAQQAAGQAAYEAALAELDLSEAAYEDGLAQYGDALAQYEAGQAAYEAALAQYEDGLAQYEAGVAAYNDGLARYEAGVAAYNDGMAAYARGEAEYEDGLAQYEDGLAAYEDGLAEYEDGRAQYEDGLAEYKDGRDTYDREVADAEAQLADAEEELASLEAPDTYLLERNTNIAYVCFESDSDIVAQVARVFPIFFILVAVLVCMTTMTRMAEEQRGRMGILKGLGYSERDIMDGFLIYAGSAAMLGCVFGYGVGVVLFPSVIWSTYQLMYIPLELRHVFDPWLMLAMAAASLLCSLGAAWLSCRRELREPTASLMRPRAPKAGKHVFLERIPFLWDRMSFMHKVSVRNIFRYKRRFFMMIVGISGCTALLLTGLGLKDSVAGFAAAQFDEIQTADAEVVFRDGRGGALPEELRQAVEALGATYMTYHASSLDALIGDRVKSVNVIAPMDGAAMDGFFRLRTTDGAPLAPPGEGEALVSVSIAERYGVRVGDTLTLRDEDMHTVSATVAGVFENHVYNYVILSPETERAALGPVDCNGAYVDFPAGADGYAAQAELAKCGCTSSVLLYRDLRDRLTKMLSSLDHIVLVVILSAAGLAFVVLYDLTNINILERIREIATIKVLGFFRRETSDYVFRENMILTLLGAAVGLVLGVWLHRFVMRQIVVDLVYFPVRVRPLSYLIAVALTFAFTLIVDRLMSFRLERIDMAESLKSVE